MTADPIYRRLALVVLLALAVRLGGVWFLRHQEPSPDAVDDYLPMAENLVAGRGFVVGDGSADSTRGPGYAVFLAGLRLVAGDSLLAIRVAQAVVDVATVLVVFALAGRLFAPRAGLGAALAYALNPLAVWACALIGPETLFAFLTTLSVLFLARGLTTARWSEFDRCGVFLGLAVLCRATPLLLVVPWAVLAWRRAGLLRAAILVFTCAAVVTPWTVRNAVVFGEFIPVVANGGVNFYAGSSPRFLGTYEEAAVEKRQRERELLDLGAVPPRREGAGPGEGDRYLLQLGLANYRLAWEESPLGVVGFALTKVGRLGFASQSGRHQLPALAINGLLFLAAIVGGIRGYRSGYRLGVVLLAGTALYFVLVFAALLPLARYVIGFAPLLSALGGASVAGASGSSVREQRPL